MITYIEILKMSMSWNVFKAKILLIRFYHKNKLLSIPYNQLLKKA